MAKRRPAPERRRQIAQAAGELFAERGVRATTVRDIGDRVGVLSGSLYHHFKTKHDIVHELMHAYVDGLLARYRGVEGLGGSALQKLERLFHACIRANLEHPAEETMLIRELGGLFDLDEFVYIHETLAEIEALFVKVIVQGKSAGEIREDVDPRFVYRMMMDVMGAVPRWYDPEQHSEDRVVEAWANLFFRGMCPPQAQARGVSESAVAS
ncbi:MAG: TetR/AcrR family transcriptional regulator [Deltaproteobacteria bacterium]|nr:TetR/AcrR family transcriptional regulator [Deltaproteobacteria bacterium]MBW2361239.1 TetR/AcrR family transcriptional regulator [Deltaproteobacteria bacterium]